MKCLFALTCAALLAAPSVPETGPGTRIFGGSPPLRYMGDAGAVTLFVMDVEHYCGAATPGFVIKGCAGRTAEGTPIMVVKNPCPRTNDDDYARLICHEIAHLRGWPGDHPL